MNDLISVDWDSQAPSQNPQQPTAPTTTAPSYSANLTNPPPSSARSSPLSARSVTPVFRGLKAPPKTSAPANDSFSSLLGPKQAKPSDNLSLQERQRQLQLEKERQWKHLDSRPGPQDAAFWDNLGSGRSTPNSTPGAQSPGAAYLSVASATDNIAAAHQSSTPQSQDEDDILAAFNSEAPVDASSHYPVPPTLQNSRANHSSSPAANLNNFSHATGVAANGSAGLADDDDDPFGLGQLASRPKPQASPQPNSREQDDDILGDLGKPVSEVRRQTVEPPHQEDRASQGREQPASDTDPRDRAVAELVDMGFPADKSAEALARTEGGIDVQAAVGYLLNQAHEEAKQKSQRRQGEGGRDNSFAPEEGARRMREPKRSNRDDNTSDAVPAWMREQGSRSSSQRRQDGRTPTEEKDVAQYAQEFGTTFLKSANSLWKQGQKKMQKALADFDQPADPNQPKWMRDATVTSNGSDSRGPEPSRRRQQEATDEAMMLEPDMGRRQKPPARSSPNPEFGRAPPSTQNRSPIPSRSSTPSHPQSATRPAKLTREAVEQQSAQAYVSPARRKKQQPATNPQHDLFSQAPSPLPVNPASTSEPQFASRNPFSPKASPAPPSAVRAPTPVRPKAPPRQVPAIPPSALSASASHRQKGTDAFKRGDYATALVAYSDALGPVPSTHPTRIVALCNRALTNIKVGDPKAAVADADAALSIIGPSRGENEKIVMGGTEADKDMKEFFVKALMRKAEGLEHMEKWTEAANSWKEAVEAGIGGAVSIQGRNRCEKAAGKGSGPQSRTNTPKPSVAAKKPLARSAKPAVSTAASAQAVKKLREANQAAEKEDDEKFALSDQVEAKLVAWKGGKADNLRALLGSLDSVLWADAGWKKVGMQDLIMPNKVKIVYMKAIAKVHPDKIPQNATTEQKMISASVFATLNEAWDKFKKDNNL
ncbi:hypothetical protein IWX90DRAFT_426847 [Phyllosticta citrichinensis]|uniref:UBA domain-containing protein n=1 Tax=Phyllosticta citrichinensis TaxID=1130410 RepID=A0ABR1XZ44_9PEZI